MRHAKAPKWVPRDETPNNRRLSSARRALKKERETYSLFVAELDQPSPEDRIKRLDDNAAHQVAFFRKWAADKWREARRRLLALPRDVRLEIEAEWQYGHLPGSHEYLLSLMHSRLRGDKRDELVGKAVDAWLAGSEPIHRNAGRRPR